MMKTKTQLTTSTIFLIFVLCLSLINVNTVLADDAPPTEPPTATEEVTAPPAEEATPIPELITETPAPPEYEIPVDAPIKDKEVSVGELLSEIPDNTDVVVLDENGDPVSLASQEAALILEEADPIWCPASQVIPTPGANGCTTSQTITTLLTLMRNNPTNFDENGIIYLEKPSGAGFTTPLILDNSVTSLGASFNTLRNFSLTIRGGWNGGNTGTFSGDTNFGVSGVNQGYIKIGVSAANPWIGSITLRDIVINDITNASNPSLAVYTSTGSVTLNDVDVDDADNSESIRITTGSGNINIFDSEVTSGDDNFGFNLTTTSGTVTLTDVLVDNHSDGDAININAGTGAVTLDNADVTDSDNGDGINVTTTSGPVNLIDVDVDNGDGANGINVTTNSGNISLNNTDVSNQQDGRTGNLFSQSGNINITNGSDFDGDNSGDFNQGFVATTNTGSITINGSDFTDAEGSGNGTNYNGATLTAPNVFLTNVSADDNDLNGIWINASTAVTLNNVSADNNGTNPTGPGNALGSGVTVIGDGSTLVSVTGGAFTDNERYGIEIINGTLNFISMPTFDDNGLGRYFPGGQDTTGPVITPNVFCTSWGNNGWCRGVLFVTWNVSEPESTVSSQSGCTTSIINSNTPLTGQTLTCTATSADGTLASANSVTVYRDGTPPTASASRLPAPNVYGWNSTDVTVTFTGIDGNSGISSCTAPITRTANAAGQSATGNCTDVAGNVSSNVTINNINIDKIPPITTFFTRTPGNGNGWNNGNVTVLWSCTDTLSGVINVSVSQAVTTEGANQSTQGTCEDRAGNKTDNMQSGINIDKTAPTLNLANVTIEATGPSGANVNYSALASDNLDASPALNCLPASGGIYPLGTTPVTCTATDHADNTSAPSSFNITVVDTTPPAIDSVSDMTVGTLNITGKYVTYPSPATSDIVDGPGFATCTPDSGNFFVIGNNPVTCSATDSHGNTATINFTIKVEEKDPSAITATGINGLLIPVTGGSSVKLNCVPPDLFNISMAGARIIFNNLCDYEAFINEVQQLELPGELPSGSKFIDGYSINIIKDGKSVNPLPQDASVAIEFNIPNNLNGTDFAVLYWNGSQWTEIAGKVTDSGHFMADLTAEITNSNTFIFVTK